MDSQTKAEVIESAVGGIAALAKEMFVRKQEQQKSLLMIRMYAGFIWEMILNCGGAFLSIPIPDSRMMSKRCRVSGL
mgnify:CR=1 FL=1